MTLKLSKGNTNIGICRSAQFVLSYVP